MPVRIQRKRTKGWRMPEGVVYVGRGSIYGNPFAHADNAIAVDAYRRWIGCMPVNTHDENLAVTKQFDFDTVMAVRDYLPRLAGRDLACWCKPSDSCHADVLLELANKSDPK